MARVRYLNSIYKFWFLIFDIHFSIFYSRFWNFDFEIFNFDCAFLKDLATFWTGEEQQRKQVNLFNRDPLFSLTKVTLAFLRQGPSNSKICIAIKSANSSSKSEVTLLLVVNVWFYTGTYLWFLSMYFRGCQKKQILAKKKK